MVSNIVLPVVPLVEWQQQRMEQVPAQIPLGRAIATTPTTTTDVEASPHIDEVLVPVDDVSNVRFRSILPHEPPLLLSSSSSSSSSMLTTSSTHIAEEQYGYLHIQGALTPKLLLVSAVETLSSSSNNNSANQPTTTTKTTAAAAKSTNQNVVTKLLHQERKVEKESTIHPTTDSSICGTGTGTNTDTSCSSSATSTFDFWVQNRTVFEYLLLLQFRYFHQKFGGCHPTTNNTTTSTTTTNNNGDAGMEPQSLQLLDVVPPYTKLRLRYRSPQLAHRALYCYRQHNITVRQLLLLQYRDDTEIIAAEGDPTFSHGGIRDRMAINFRFILLQEVQSGGLVIPDRLLQITEITNRPLLSTTTKSRTYRDSDIENEEEHDNEKDIKHQSLVDTICWTKSNPPKFRRLIARPYEDVHLIERQRQTTRFIVITNLLPPSLPIVSSNASITTTAIGVVDDATITTDLYTMWESDPTSISYAIRSILNAYDTSGYGIEVFVPSQVNKRTRYCHVGMRSSIDARTVVQSLQETIVQWPWITGEYDDENHWSSTEDMNDNKNNNKNNNNNSTNHNIRAITSGKLFIDYADITQRSITSTKETTTELAVSSLSLIDGMDPSSLLLGHPSRPQCTSTTDDIHIHGLIVIPDYISTAEEEVLLAILNGPQAPWAPSQKTASYENGIVRRLVQHYGYVFDYQTANVLRDRSIPNANCPPMPAMDVESLDDTDGTISTLLLEDYIKKCIREGRGWEVMAGIIERTRRYQFVTKNSDDDNETASSFPHLNQLTLNHYKPGEGIGSHVDTPSAFADGLISISLNSGTVMEFRNAKDPKQRKKLVYLPPRSMLLMSKDARYEWEHMIVTRMTDTYNDKVLPRKLRVSLTLRTALTEDGTSHLPLVESKHYPPVWGESSPSLAESIIMKATATNDLATPACERDHVHKVYDAIATQWHHTRGKRGVLWPGATQFLQRLSPGSIVADVGCGDGKYFPAIWEAGSFVIGSDISEPLLRTAIHDGTCDELIPENCRVSDHRQHLRNHPAVIVADCMNVPLRTSSCDAAICIAVLHHISTLARRKRCIEELVRIVKPGGMVNVQAWALEQEDSSRRKFASNDVFVPFNAQPKYLKLNGINVDGKTNGANKANGSVGIKSTAQVYSEALNAEYDESKGLVVFQRYCHLYRLGELEEIVADVPGVELIDTGFETGNYFIIFQVQK